MFFFIQKKKKKKKKKVDRRGLNGWLKTSRIGKCAAKTREAQVCGGRKAQKEPIPVASKKWDDEIYREELRGSHKSKR